MHGVSTGSGASLRYAAGETEIPGPFRAPVYIMVDNVESVVPSVADADIVLPLRKTTYDFHEIGVREPGGNIVIFASRLA